jgi:N,N-dimethylformamidase
MDSKEDGYLIGYLDRFSYRPGETALCMVSTTAEEVVIDVIRLLRATKDEAFEAGYGPKVDAIRELTAPAAAQIAICGSYIIARDVVRRPTAQIELSLVIWPTRPQGGAFQGLASLLDVQGRSVLSLGLDKDGVPVLKAGDELLLRARRAAIDRRWYRLHLKTDAHRAELRVSALTPLPGETEADVARGEGCDLCPARHVLLAAAALDEDRVGRPVFPYDGKLERPVLSSSAGVLAEWAFELTPSGDHIEDISGCGAHGVAINAPARMMTGSGWDGTVHDPRLDPRGHSAIHFHADDIDDARWEPTAKIDLPTNLTSGVYAVRLRAWGGRRADLVPFAVASNGGSGARAALLLPTLSYQAYANLHPPEDPPHPLDPLDQLQLRRPDLGKSLYDKHADGSGVSMATMARPMLQCRPGYRSWLTGCLRHFSADLYLVEWIAVKGVGIDIICDHDLDSDLGGALDVYDVVLTGSHPEYCTGRMLDALERHVGSGGHLLYLGGNGFYWVTSRAPTNSDLIEVRRYAGTRTWDGEPGERHHSTTGEFGGLWRDRGRAPNRLTGVGMTAQGWLYATGYRRTAASYEPAWSWIFDGVATEMFGEYGFCLGGASGDELDRFDVRLGSPANGVVLASSLPHSGGYHAVVEDVLAVEGDLSAASSANVRSDMVIVEHASGGYSFSTGSIAFLGSLTWNDADNDVSRILSNVLQRCLALGRGRAETVRDRA